MPETLDLAAFVRRRRHALMAKWASGKKLSDEERAEVADLLPPLPQEPAAAATSPAPAAHDLRLESPVEGESGKKYRKTVMEYAAGYCASRRTIIRWRGKGAPLDDPSKMAAWWHEKMDHEPSEKDLATWQRLAEEAAPHVEAAAVISAQKEAPAASWSAGSSILVQLDIARSLATAEAEELRAALESKDASRIAVARVAYKNAGESLRKLEIAAPKIALAAGALIEKETLRATLIPIHTSLASGVRSFFKKARQELGLNLTPQQELKWQEMIENLFSRFRHGDYAVDAG